MNYKPPKGLSVIPITMPTKAPAIPEWKQYQERQPREGELMYDGSVALICGRVSGNVEVIDIDSKNDASGTLLEQFWKALEEYPFEGADEIVIQQTVSGGFHLMYRCDIIEGNQKLAKQFDKKALIETRGEGGYVAIEPTKGYKILNGSLENIPKISVEARDTILSICRSFNQHFVEKRQPKSSTPDEDAPWVKYNEQGDIPALLLQHGWKFVRTHGENDQYRRPEKSDGISASWSEIKRMFYCFTSSTNFEPSTGYSPSAVYAVLECGGDFSEAGRRLRELYPSEKKHEPREQPKRDAIPKKDYTAMCRNIRNSKDNVLAESTGINRLNGKLMVRPGFMYTITGWPGSGKSEFVTQLCVLQAQKNRRVCIYAPEGYPIENYIMQVVCCKIGKPVYKFFSGHCTDQEFEDGLQWVLKYFSFLDWEDSPTLDDVLHEWHKHIELGYKVFVIDPFNSLISGQSKSANFAIDLKNELNKIVKITHSTNIISFIIEHPASPKDSTIAKQAPRSYQLFGGTMWWNKTDVMVSVHALREDNGSYAKSADGLGITEIHVLKVKNQKLNGHTGMIELNFNIATGRYE
jgi:hypothetical protein